MSKHPLSYLAYSAVALLATIYGFFYTTGVAAQTPSTLPDLTITKATLNGAALNFLYHNLGRGAAKPEVSFWYEWVDGQGRRLGNLYWIDVGEMGGGSKREGNQLLEFSTLQWERGEIKLADLIYSPPEGADHLKLAIDGPNKYAESNEQNNVVLLPVLRPDFIITDAKFHNDFLSFRYHNRGNIGHQEGKKISFWFEWVDARGLRLGDLYWFDTTPPGTGPLRFAQLAEFDSTKTLYSARGAISFTSFLNSAPDGSTHLKIAIDGPNAYAESNEGNNITIVDRSKLTTPKLVTPPLPDTAETPSPKLTLTLSSEIVSPNGETEEAHPGDSVRSTFTVKNVGEVSATGLSLSLYCPKNTTLKSAEFNGKNKKQEALRRIAAPDLNKDALHRLVIMCSINDDLASKGKSALKFTGTAKLSGENRAFQSNTVTVVVVREVKKAKSLETEPESSPLPQTPPKKLEEPKPEPQNAFPRQDLSTDSDFGF